ncbi:lipoprotein [Micromonospora sp. ATCC 39149]|uniref:DUF4349 domain-containing protein n=1 Tax=Micromonospora carbonacea TaxID=47853 RepID=A0A7D5Y9I0_9ACTN|nr:DUF4349 domain-containing protein [Micromonospora sp. ATCC 39149]EEP73278.1 lipoprotein [Micromonospora sp. ATCC 39149]QLJ99299.1 DUF4349 domain-containing protein [Micromonospora carbonacea]
MDGHARRRLLTAVGLVALLAAGGCSADSDGAGEPSAAVAPEQAAPADGGKAEQGADAGGTRSGAGGGSPDLRVDQRSIIYTGTMRVRVDDVDAAARSAITAVTGVGGFVGGDERSSGGTADARAELQLRVPAERFTAVLEELARLGRQEQRAIRTEDVTEETVDLDARIATQRARVESGRKLLARATSIGDLVTLESEVARREADLASLEAKKRRLADLTSLSTITLTLVGPEAEARDTEPDTGFVVGLRGGWTAFVASLGVLLTVLGALLPFAVALGVPVAVLLAVLRRRRRRPPAPAVNAPPPVPAARSAP